MSQISNLVRTTGAGAVRGIVSDGVQRFLSIPYAAPPVGALRFKAPQPPTSWSGERDATQAGATAPQRHNRFPDLDVVPLIGTGWTKGDDYLTLNVLRPDSDAEGLPVMVFIHGGGYVLGSKDAPVQDGATFARDGIIYVAINYRLGMDGFLPIPGVPTNLGLRDQIAALHWVQENVAAFGGDPANVTVFGESAGAMSIANLVASPLTEGLFRRAILQSGHGGMTREIAVAERLVRKLAKLLKVTPDAAGFAGVDHEAAFDAMTRLAKPGKIDLRGADGLEPVFGISRFVPVHGDDVLPEQPLAAVARGAGARVDLLIGTNAEEMNLYLVPTGVREKVPGLLARFFLAKSMRRAGKALKAYGLGRKGVKAGHALTDAMNDLVFRWPARRFAEEHRGRTHFYEFDWRSPALGLGACHGMELPFVFDCLPVATGEQGLVGTNPPQELAERVHRIWVDYARDGSVPWSEFDRVTRQVYSLSEGKARREAPMPAAAFLP